jgi:biopolymer transport protein ExbB
VESLLQTISELTASGAAWIERYAPGVRAWWERAEAVWVAGGGGMIAIALDAAVLLALGVHVWLKLRATGFRSLRETDLRRWIEHPAEREGPIGAQLDELLAAPTAQVAAAAAQGLQLTELAPFERDLKAMKVAVTAAPLLGLFGTVTGMLATFGALASGSGGEQTMGMIAKGISEALITTETGLVVALPGLLFQYQLGRQAERYRAFLAHVETLCTHHLHFRARKAA